MIHAIGAAGTAKDQGGAKDIAKFLGVSRDVASIPGPGPRSLIGSGGVDDAARATGPRSSDIGMAWVRLVGWSPFVGHSGEIVIVWVERDDLNHPDSESTSPSLPN